MGILFAIPGLLRTVGCVLVAAAPIVSELPIPAISAWGAVISQVGTVLCGVGVARAGLRNFTESFKR